MSECDGQTSALCERFKLQLQLQHVTSQLVVTMHLHATGIPAAVGLALHFITEKD
jgi:hypothetical protein